MKTLALLFTIFALSTALPSIHVNGKKLFTSNGDRFYAIGLDYQPSAASGGDPLADVDGLTRDIPYFKQLGINAIRVYSASATTNHDAGMKLLSDAGIYVLLDATEPAHSVDPANPQWNTDIFTAIQAKLSNFAKYDNILGFLAGNEVVNSDAQIVAAPYVKAAVRDVKSYLRSIGSSALVGYAATDVAANDFLQPFLDCDSANTSVDFYGLNTYRWCNGNNYQTSGYAGLISDKFERPVLFTEYGCNREQPRTFDEVQAIYGSQMAASLSGGFVYEYTQEANKYGLVSVSGNTVTTFADFDNFKNQVAQIKPENIQESSYNAPSSTVESCPTKTSTYNVQAFPLPPTPDNDLCSCMAASLTCTVNPSSSVKDIQSAVSSACGSVSCAAITSDYNSASYGQWSMCSSIQRASYALDVYHSKYSSSQGSKSCDFNGVGKIQTPVSCSANPVVTPSQSQTASQSISQSASQSASQTASASQSASLVQSASQTASTVIIGADGSSVSGSVSQTFSSSASASASASATATASQSASQSASASGSLSQNVATVNKYQTEWDAAFSSSSTITPFLTAVIAAIILVIMQ